MNFKTPALAAVIGLSVLSMSAQAARISQDQVDSISNGESTASVIQDLGQPANTPTWADGSHSLVYGMSNGSDPSARAYIDVKDGKVTGVQFGNDGGDN